MLVQQDHYKKSYYETPFHSRTSELNILNEWQRWKDYTVATNYFRTDLEYFAVRNTTGVIDYTPMIKQKITGPDSAEFVNRFFTRDMNKISIGRVGYVVWCDEQGQVLDDGTVFHIRENDYWLLCVESQLDNLAISALGFEFNNNHNGLYDILSGSEPIKKVIKKSTSSNLDIIASNIDLVGVEIELINESKREYRLKSSLDSISKSYDFIIIDCAPSLGLITINALTACNSVIVPIQCEYFALEGLGKLLNTIKSIQKLHNKELDIEGLLLTMFDTRLRLSNQVVDEVIKHFGDMVFKTIIKRNIKLGEAPGFGKDIIRYDATSKGTKNYLSLANEIIQRNKN